MTKKNSTICNIELTSREVDIISCITSGKSAKGIAEILFIAPKTVETHIHKILKKFGCSSKEQVIHKLEKSSEFFRIKNHYNSILMENDFRDALLEISKKIKADKVACLYHNVSDKIVQYLSKAGIRNLKNTITERNYFIVQDITKDTLEVADSFSSKKNIIFVTQDESLTLDIECVLIKNKNVHLLIFEIIQFIFPKINIDEIVTPYKRRWSNYSFASEGDETKNQSPLSKKQYAYIYIAIFLLLLIVTSFAVYKNTYVDEAFVSSEFHITNDSQLLKRSYFLKEMKKKFYLNDNIQMLILTGIGGSGKTTLVRQFCQTEKTQVVWELNAEKKETLINSFEYLAIALTKTKSEKEEIDSIFRTEQKDKRISYILAFVKERLSKKKNWILIFDNVDKLSNIQKFLPNDVKTWGKGKVLITTRNLNIRDHNCVNRDNVIKIKHLTEKEKFDLFTKIILGKSVNALSKQEKNNIYSFLSNIPPFPLDISTAAYYIKNTKISYTDYVKCMNSYSDDFLKSQTHLRKELNEYAETRTSIVSLTLKNIIKQHPDFRKLLLMISLIDSQNIPKNLLVSYTNEIVVDHFLYELKKHSFITKDVHEVSKNYHVFSCHKSISEAIFKYLFRYTESEKLKKATHSNIRVIELYYNKIIDCADIVWLRSELPHILSLEKFESIASNASKGIMKFLIGRVYYYLGNFNKAAIYFEDSIICLRQQKDLKDQISLGKALSYLGIVTRQCDSKKSLELLKESLSVYQKVTSPKSPYIGWVYLYMGNTLNHIGDYKNAKYYIEHGIAIYDRYTDNHSKAQKAWGLAFLGDVYRATGNYQKSLYLYEASLAILQHTGDLHPCRSAWFSFRNGILYKRMGNCKKSLELLDKCYLDYQKNNPEYYDKIARCLVHLGEAYLIQGSYKKALELIEKGIEICREHYGETHIKTMRYKVILAYAYIQVNEPQKARYILEKTWPILENFFGKNHMRLAWLLKYLGIALHRTGKSERAVNCFEKSIEISTKHYGKNHFETMRILRDYASILIDMGSYDLAENNLKKSLYVLEKNDHGGRQLCLEFLGDLYFRKYIDGKYQTNKKELKEKSVSYIQQSINLVKTLYPPDSDHLERLKAKLDTYSQKRIT